MSRAFNNFTGYDKKRLRIGVRAWVLTVEPKVNHRILHPNCTHNR